MGDDGQPIQLGRTAPFNLEAEQALLGAILVNNDALDRVTGLEPEHFFDPLHRQIYETAATVIGDGKPATPITLRDFFENAVPVGPEPVVAYLGRLAANATTIINVRDYARTVHDLATRRQLILIGEDMVNAAYDTPVDFPANEQIEEAEARLYSLAEHGHSDRTESDHPAILDAAVRMIEDAYRNPGKLVGLSTGLLDLDRRIGGLRPGHLIVVGGRPSMGKTSLAGTFLDAQTEPVLFFSMEMVGEEIGLRELAAETGLASDQMLRGELTEEQMSQVFAAQARLSKRPVTVVQASGLTIAQVSTMARRIKRQRRIKLVVTAEDGLSTKGSTGKLVLNILGAIAQFERDLILERTRAGLAAARKRGQRLGPPVKWSPDMVAKARRLMEKDGLNANDAAKVLGVSRRTMFRGLKAARDHDMLAGNSH